MVTMVGIAALVIVAVWFLRGGSFRLYASLFFGLYSLTKLSWLAIFLVAVIQNIVFLPFRIMYERYYGKIKDFEDEIEKTKSEDQYILLNKRIRHGDKSIIFYIFNFVFLFIAFTSAGRVFLLEFYRTPIAQHYLYSFIPYPEYPLEGVWFHFPMLVVKASRAIAWKDILSVWGWLVLGLVVLRLGWRLLKPLLSKNKSLLKVRIKYNRIMLTIGGFIGIFLIVSTWFLRHIPTEVGLTMLSVDLSKQNTTFNLITGIASFLAALYSGWQHRKEDSQRAKKTGISMEIIENVNQEKRRISLRNAILLGFSAFWLTRLMPCSHDLSVMSFELLYVVSPITFDLLIPKSKDR